MGTGPAFNIEISFDSVEEAKKWLKSQKDLKIKHYTILEPHICEGEITFKNQKFDFVYLEEENEYWGNGEYEKALIITYQVDFTEEMHVLKTKIDKLCELEKKLIGKSDRKFYAAAYTI